MPTKYTRGTTSYTDRTTRTRTKQKEKKKKLKKTPKQYVVGRRVTVTVSVNRRSKWGANTKRRESLSAPTSHLHPPSKVPKHTDSIERIDSTRTRRLTRSTTALIPKVERPGHT